MGNLARECSQKQWICTEVLLLWMGTPSYLVWTVETSNPLTIETNGKDSSRKWGNQSLEMGEEVWIYALSSGSVFIVLFRLLTPSFSFSSKFLAFLLLFEIICFNNWGTTAVSLGKTYGHPLDFYTRKTCSPLVQLSWPLSSSCFQPIHFPLTHTLPIPSPFPVSSSFHYLDTDTWGSK